MEIKNSIQMTIDFLFDHFLLIFMAVLFVVILRVKFLRTIFILIIAAIITLNSFGIIPVKDFVLSYVQKGNQAEYVFQKSLTMEEDLPIATVKIELYGGKIKVMAGDEKNINIKSQIDDIEVISTMTGEEKNTLIRESHFMSKANLLSRETVVGFGRNQKWNLIVDSGVSSLDLDVKNVNMKNISIITGGGSANIALGDNVETLNISGGASNIKLDVPESLGILITANGLYNDNFKIAGLEKTTMGYQSKDLGKKERIMHLNVEVGFSNLEINCYGQGMVAIN